MNSPPSLSANLQPAPRRIELPSRPHCTSFVLIGAIYFTSGQRTIGPEPILATVGPSLAALFIVALVGGAILYSLRRGVSDPTAIRRARARVESLVDSSSLDREEVAWRYLRKQNLDGGGRRTSEPRSQSSRPCPATATFAVWAGGNCDSTVGNDVQPVRSEMSSGFDRKRSKRRE